MSNRRRPTGGTAGSTAGSRPGTRSGVPDGSGTSALRRVLPLLLAAALGALLAGPVAAAVTSAATGPSTADRAYAEQVEGLRAADAERDVAQVEELTALARDTRDTLAPILDGLAAALPPGAAAGSPGTVAVPADADTVAGWRVATTAAVASFADPPSGGTAVNVARSGLTAAVRTLDTAVASYGAALAVPEPARAELLALAGEQRDNAVATWSVAATQLDVVNIDSGYGHAHVFLPAVPGAGALTADSEPEGVQGR